MPKPVPTAPQPSPSLPEALESQRRVADDEAKLEYNVDVMEAHRRSPERAAELAAMRATPTYTETYRRVLAAPTADRGLAEAAKEARLERSKTTLDASALAYVEAMEAASQAAERKGRKPAEEVAPGKYALVDLRTGRAYYGVP